eukprot:jgi/Galph1/1235/GphlegSOOS_G5983.1
MSSLETSEPSPFKPPPSSFVEGRNVQSAGTMQENKSDVPPNYVMSLADIAAASRPFGVPNSQSLGTPFSMDNSQEIPRSLNLEASLKVNELSSKKLMPGLPEGYGSGPCSTGSSSYFSRLGAAADGDVLRYIQSRYPTPSSCFNTTDLYSAMPGTSSFATPPLPMWNGQHGRVSEDGTCLANDLSDPAGRDKLIYDLERINHWLRSELEASRREIDRLRAQLAEYERGKNKQEYTKSQSRYWTPNEHQRFLEALRKFGHKDVKSISNYVGTRNPTQVRTHAQKYFLRLFKESRNRQEQGIGRGFSANRRSMSEPDLNRAELQNSSSQMYMQEGELQQQDQKENDSSSSANVENQGIEPKNGISLLSLVATNETSQREQGFLQGQDEHMNIQDSA